MAGVYSNGNAEGPETKFSLVFSNEQRNFPLKISIFSNQIKQRFENKTGLNDFHCGSVVERNSNVGN